MNLHGKDIKIFTANSNPKVAAEIAACLGLPVGKSEVKTFSDGEIAVSIQESVRGSDVFVVQSTCTPVNDNLMELLIMIDAFKRAGMKDVTIRIYPEGRHEMLNESNHEAVYADILRWLEAR